jgi:predicted dehydrogenase
MTAASTITRGAAARTRPRLGFLGVGWIGRHRMDAIAACGVAEIAAMADASEVALESAREHAPSCEIAGSLEELLRAELDGIVIATPSAMHAAQAIEALERGVAVFCQKPLARTAAETRSVVEAARVADRLLGVDLSYRFTEGMRRIRQLVRGGELGSIYAIDLVFHNAYGPDKPWFFDPRLSGGGCVIDLGIHLVDLALWTLDFPRVIGATSRLFSRGEPLRDVLSRVEDFAEARIDLEGGATVRLACSWNLPAGRDAVIEASFYGTRGGAAMRNVNGSFFDFRAERFRGTARETLSEPPDAWGGRAAVEWARQLGRDNRYDPEIEHLIEVAAALDVIYER